MLVYQRVPKKTMKMSLGTETDQNRSWNQAAVAEMPPAPSRTSATSRERSISLGGNRKGMGKSLPENQHGSHGKNMENEFAAWNCHLFSFCLEFWGSSSTVGPLLLATCLGFHLHPKNICPQSGTYLTTWDKPVRGYKINELLGGDLWVAPNLGLPDPIGTASERLLPQREDCKPQQIEGWPNKNPWTFSIVFSWKLGYSCQV